MFLSLFRNVLSRISVCILLQIFIFGPFAGMVWLCSIQEWYTCVFPFRNGMYTCMYVPIQEWYGEVAAGTGSSRESR